MGLGAPPGWLRNVVVGTENHSRLRATEADCIVDVAARETDVGKHAIVKRVQFVESLSTAPLGSERSDDRLDPLRERMLESGPAIGPAGQRMSGNGHVNFPFRRCVTA